MKKALKKNIIPDISEFTDNDGKKWVQTSTDDLFSMKELNEILESVEKEKNSSEIVLARIDFQKVNKEYYDAAITLQSKLHKQTELLKKVITESKKTIEKKNNKLKELIEYIKKMHLFLAYLESNQDGIDKVNIPTDVLIKTISETPTVKKAEESIYEDVEEIVISLDTKEEDLLK